MLWTIAVSLIILWVLGLVTGYTMGYFMKPSRRIPRPVDGDECGAGGRGMPSPSSGFLRCPALWAG